VFFETFFSDSLINIKEIPNARGIMIPNWRMRVAATAKHVPNMKSFLCSPLIPRIKKRKLSVQILKKGTSVMNDIDSTKKSGLIAKTKALKKAADRRTLVSLSRK
jgi:hypothetical protein